MHARMIAIALVLVCLSALGLPGCACRRDGRGAHRMLEDVEPSPSPNRVAVTASEYLPIPEEPPPTATPDDPRPAMMLEDLAPHAVHPEDAKGPRPLPREPRR